MDRALTFAEPILFSGTINIITGEMIAIVEVLMEPETVWVVSSDVRLTGHIIHGVFTEKPTPEQVAMYGYLAQGTGYAHTTAQPVQLNVPNVIESDEKDWVIVTQY